MLLHLRKKWSNAPFTLARSLLLLRRCLWVADLSLSHLVRHCFLQLTPEITGFRGCIHVHHYYTSAELGSSRFFLPALLYEYLPLLALLPAAPGDPTGYFGYPSTNRKCAPCSSGVALLQTKKLVASEPLLLATPRTRKLYLGSARQGNMSQTWFHKPENALKRANGECKDSIAPFEP